jgi:hypothetical protein
MPIKWERAMKKLGAVLAVVEALSTVAWGAGLSPAAAADPTQVVNIQCTLFPQSVHGVDASPALKGSLALACPKEGRKGASCAECEAALLTRGYQLDAAFNVIQSTAVYAGAYYVFSK